ncbi:hypothetical protein SO802_001804 [Lithocarpus litseifolius]|uniref:Uncharacterized protein n=1 Tax=Lithocarpus litseifolius TaxID=425828 RepID=A0AAW2DZH0_9ROSI
MAMAHILVLPFPAQGHVNPLILLSRKKVKHGFKITFVNTDFNHNRVVGALDSLMDSNISLVSIPDGLGPEDDRNELGKLCEAMLRTMLEKLEELINYINASNGNDKIISCIVADAAGMGWAIEVGIKMGIKRAFFRPGTAASLALQVSIPRLIDDGIINSDGMSSPPMAGYGQPFLLDLPPEIKESIQVVPFLIVARSVDKLAWKGSSKGKFRICLMLQETKFQAQVLKPCKSVQESSEEVLFIKLKLDS